MDLLILFIVNSILETGAPLSKSKPIKVIYRDAFILAAHKPFGIATYGEGKAGAALSCKEQLEEQLNQCRTRRLDLPSVAHESKTSLALTTYVAAQSKGLAIQVDHAPAAMKQVEAGRALFNQRMGQLNLSCAQCHDQRAGLKLGGSAIPQAHPTGYPIYRLEWQSVGSLERRLRNCMIGVRAEPFPFDSTEIKQLEAFLMWRARGLLIETPGVRP